MEDEDAPFRVEEEQNDSFEHQDRKIYPRWPLGSNSALMLPSSFFFFFDVLFDVFY